MPPRNRNKAMGDKRARPQPDVESDRSRRVADLRIGEDEPVKRQLDPEILKMRYEYELKLRELEGQLKQRELERQLKQRELEALERQKQREHELAVLKKQMELERLRSSTREGGQMSPSRDISNGAGAVSEVEVFSKRGRSVFEKSKVLKENGSEEGERSERGRRSVKGSASESAEEPEHESEIASSFSALVRTEVKTCSDVFLPVASRGGSLSARCTEGQSLVQDLPVDSATSKNSSDAALNIELEETATCSNASTDFMQRPDVGVLTAEWSLEKELSARKGALLEGQSTETGVDLCCTRRSVSGGLVAVEVSSSGELGDFQVIANASSTQESPRDAVLQDASCSSAGAGELRRNGADIWESLVIAATDEVRLVVDGESCSDVPGSDQAHTDSVMPSEQIAMQEMLSDTSETRSSSPSETMRTSLELEWYSVERRNLSQIEEENEASFLRGDERLDIDSSFEDGSSSSRSQLKSVLQPSLKSKYTGHRKARTRIKDNKL